MLFVTSCNVLLCLCVLVEDYVMPDEFSEDEDLPKGSLSKDEDSDFVMDEDDESGSDWEASQRSSQKSKSRVC